MALVPFLVTVLTFLAALQFVIYTQPRSSSYFSTIPFSPDLRRPAASFNRASDFEKALMQVGRDRVRV